MKALVTGGAGFIGSHIQDNLVEQNFEVAVLDNLVTGKKGNLNPKAEFFEADIANLTELSRIIDDFRPEVIFHLAAQNDVPTSMKDPDLDAKVNILGMVNLMHATKNSSVKKIIYSNTGGAFYGEVPENALPIKEEQPVLKPTSFYGVSKHSAELYLRLFAPLQGIRWVSLRYSNVYGPRQDGNKEAGVIAIFTQKMLNGETPVINGDGLHTRDYVYVDDVVDANLKALEFNQSDYFNISTATQIRNIEVFETIESELQTGTKVEYGPERPGDARNVSLSFEKAKQILNWEPKVDFKEGVKRTIQYYKKP